MDTKKLYLEIGNRIKKLRSDLGLKQEVAARLAGISRTSLANIEAGRQQILVHHLVGIAKALELNSAADLLLPLNTGSKVNKVESELPLSKKGLTKEQRLEVLNLMSDVFISPRSDE